MKLPRYTFHSLLIITVKYFKTFAVLMSFSTFFQKSVLTIETLTLLESSVSILKLRFVGSFIQLEHNNFVKDENGFF